MMSSLFHGQSDRATGLPSWEVTAFIWKVVIYDHDHMSISFDIIACHAWGGFPKWKVLATCLGYYALNINVSLTSWGPDADSAPPYFFHAKLTPL